MLNNFFSCLFINIWEIIKIYFLTIIKNILQITVECKSFLKIRILFKSTWPLLLLIIYKRLSTTRWARRLLLLNFLWIHNFITIIQKNRRLNLLLLLLLFLFTKVKFVRRHTFRSPLIKWRWYLIGLPWRI